MSTSEIDRGAAGVDDLYADAGHLHVNTGGETIHAKRLTGKWRTIKWLAASVWLIYFFGPYLRWEGRQAVLWDIPNRQYHIFSATVLPQDFWMLSLLLLFFAILLAVITALAGRVWCGYFCFQTVWTDVFTWIEEKIEGQPPARRKLDKAPWDLRKLRLRGTKYLIWLVIGFLTGVGFVTWFTDAPSFWGRFFTGQMDPTAYLTVALFTVGTFGLAGILREQACFWLCPYARIQGVMLDRTTVIPTYDLARGEPRGRMVKGKQAQERATGDCVDCNLCVAVCPTGIDIRNGQQEGCITCGLCLDACDAVMEKVGRPKGLIRYASLDELEGKPTRPMLKRPRVWVYSAILLLAWIGIIYGFSTMSVIEVKVLHERSPLFTQLSDGSIQNKFTLKLLNKSPEDLAMRITATGPKGLALIGADEPVQTRHGEVIPVTVFVKVAKKDLAEEREPVTFVVEGQRSTGVPVRAERTSVFFGPKR